MLLKSCVNELVIFCVIFLCPLSGLDGSELKNNINDQQMVDDDLCLEECTCGLEQNELCNPGISRILDGCGCCFVCARQRGEYCSRIYSCEKTLECVLQSRSANIRTCQVPDDIVKEEDESLRSGCKVKGVLYSSGEQFLMDCRTSCTCQNGTYGCISLCPHELIRPSSQCANPHLVQLNLDTCCKEWICDNHSINDHDDNPECTHRVTEWSQCSATCGLGYSLRMSNKNPSCQMRSERRMCQIIPCKIAEKISEIGSSKFHRMRHHKKCRNTLRFSNPTFLQSLSNPGCVSIKRYRPRFCGFCPGEVDSVPQQCLPFNTTTVSIPFKCKNKPESGAELKMFKFMNIRKCQCDS